MVGEGKFLDPVSEVKILSEIEDLLIGKDKIASYNANLFCSKIIFYF